MEQPLPESPQPATPSATPEPARDEGRAARGKLDLAALVRLDTRALAAFRIGLAVLYVGSMLRRFVVRDEFYGPSSLLPPDFPALDWNREHLPSFFWTLTSDGEVLAGFAISTLVFTLFGLGLFTRVTSVLSWIALIALHNRMEFVETGGDIVLLLIALYATLMPLGDRWSLDALLRARRGDTAGASVRPVAARIAPTFGLVLLQWALIYGMNAVAKNGPEWRAGRAVRYALRVDRLNTWLGYELADAPSLVIGAMTYGTLVIEFALPFLLLAPILWQRSRALAAALIVALHGGIAATMNVGVFSFAMMSIVPLLLPPSLYEWLERALARVGARFAAPDVAAPAPALGRAQLGVHVGVLALLATAAVYQACYERLPIPGFVYPRPEWFTRIADVIRWRQGWTMFAPHPPGEADLIMVDARTVDGTHVDPMQGHLTGRYEPLRALPGTQGLNHFWIAYQDRIHRGHQAGRWAALARWIDAHPERSGRADERIDGFAAYRLFTSTFERWRGDPRPEGRARGERFFANDAAIPLRLRVEDGVPDAARMVDGAVAPAEFVFSTPLAATLASGCARADFELDREARPTHAFVQAYATGRYLLLGSPDGTSFVPLGSVRMRRDERFESVVVPLSGAPIRHLRVIARAADGRASIAELRIYEGDPGLPLDAMREAFAAPLEPGAPPDAPYREPLLHRPGAGAPCVDANGERPVLRPESPVRLRF